MEWRRKHENVYENLTGGQAGLDAEEPIKWRMLVLTQCIVDRKQQNQMSALVFLFIYFDYNDKKTRIGKYSVAELCACKTQVKH